MQTEGKHILVTGAGSGFGRGAALALAEMGHHVIAGTISDAEAADLGTAHPNLDAHKLDITNADDLAAARDLDVDVLLNNAGLGQLGPVADVPMEDVRRCSR
jgi:NAD(P)-dependent dehydrogenase (short-subunit alcohol dehydrogenase family)